MDGTTRHRLLAVGLCCYLLVVVALLGPLAGAGTTKVAASTTPAADEQMVPAAADEQARSEPNVKLVRVYVNGRKKFWPYTSRGQDFETLTLPINVVFREDAETVRRLLAASTADSDSQWRTTTPDNETVVLNGTRTRWADSDGALRYTYVHTESGGRWLDETYQLHDGTYFGTRYHLRLYDGGTKDRPWTAVQAHHEHWDWFRLRHTVGSLARAQQHVEQDFYGTQYLGDIERERYANGGIMDSDGWVTIIDLVDWTFGGPQVTLAPATLALLAAVSDRWETVRQTVEESVVTDRLTGHHVGLFVTMAGLPLAVRLASITLEQETPLGNSPKVIAALFFPVVAFGIPIVAGILGERLRADDGFVVAALGLGLGFLFDYSFLQLTALPIEVVLHRLTLLFAVGLIAAGGVRWSDDVVARHGYTLVGASLWVITLLWSLLGF